MRKSFAIAFLLCGVVLFINGCVSSGINGEQECVLLVWLDWFFKPDINGNAPFQILGMGLNVLIPGAGTVLGLVGTAYSQVRASKWKTAFTATAQVIESGAAHGLTVEELKPHLADAHIIAGVDKVIAPVVAKIQPDLLPIDHGDGREPTFS